MELVETSKAIIDLLKPKWWVIENTRSGSKFIKKILGNYRQVLGPFYLWGNYILFDAKVDAAHKANNDVWSTDPLRSNKKAKVPLEISRALKDALDNQSILDVEY